MRQWHEAPSVEQFEVAIISDPDDFEIIDHAESDIKLYRLKENIIDQESAVREEATFGNQKSDTVRKFEEFNKRVFLDHNIIRHMLSENFDINNASYGGQERQGLSVSAESLGLVSATLFAGLLGLGAIFNEVIIVPVVAWSMIVLGLGFFAMGKMTTHLTR